MTSLVWFRDDLRLVDHPALLAAAERGEPVTALYILDDRAAGRPLGGASKWWLHHSLNALRGALDEHGVQLVLRRGPAETVLPEVVQEVGARSVVWNRRYGNAREIDAQLKSALRAGGLEVQSFAANLLYEPWTIQTGSGTPYAVYTPFWRACLAAPAPRQPLPAPERIHGGAPIASDALDDWALLPTAPDWAGGLRENWVPGEAGAQRRLAAVVAGGLSDYGVGRDFADRAVTSRLSPHLRFGELSPFQLWAATQSLTASAPAEVAKFRSELGWREFAWHTLFSFPELATRNWRASFDAFPWPEHNPVAFAAWTAGETGIDLVDAGMRELWHTGTMHNRVRMVVASLLTKNLLIDWRRGEQWFWDTLVDADEAANPFNWQWVAGSGVDAAPYFRIFNPELQAAKFDPSGQYRQRWLGDGLRPQPIVDLAASRTAALDAYKSIR